MNKNYWLGAEQELRARKKQLAVHVSAALLALPLMGGAASPEPLDGQPLGTGTTRIGPGPEPVVPQPLPSKPPVRATTATAQEFPGIPWGSFLVFPELVFAATYDDNIYGQRSNEVKDTVFTLSPSVVVKSKWAQHGLNFEVGADVDRYLEKDQEDVNDYWAGFDGHYDFNALTNVFGGARYARDHEDRSTPGAASPALQVEPTLYDHREAHFGLATGVDKFRLRAGGTYDEYDFKNGTNATGASVDNDFRDRKMDSLGARASYVYSPNYEYFAQYATDNRDYENNIPGQTFNRDSDGYRAAVGLKFTLPERAVSGEVFAGTLQQSFDYGGFASVSEPYYGALVAWRPTPLVSVTGFIDRSLEETNVYSGSTYASSTLDTTYGFEVERRVANNLTVNGRAAYTRSVYYNFGRFDQIVDAGAGLRYYVSPEVFLGADLRIIDRNSGDPEAQYSRNQLMFSVGYTPARSKNYSIIPEAGAPVAPGAQGLHSGFYAGAQIGHGALSTETLGPRGGGGFDSGDMAGFGETYGAFAGWGQEMGNWYFGVEVDASDSNAGWYHSKNKADARTMRVDKDMSYGVSARAGYLVEGGLVYGKLGVVNTDFHTYYTENQSAAAGAFDQDHNETGTRWGLGLEMAASSDLFVRLAYSYTKYDEYDVPYFDLSGGGSGAVVTEKFDGRDTLFSVGVGYRFGGERPALAKRSAAELNGLYAGASLGHGTLNTQLTGLHRDGGGGPYEFAGDFGKAGGTGGFFAGYGYTYGQAYVGAELEAESANFGWYHERQTGGGGGRDFAVEKRSSTGASLRLGYVLGNGGLLYGRIGEVRTRFNTIYNKGANSAEWIDRSDEVNGTRIGFGAELLASSSGFVRMDYSYTEYDSYGFATGHSSGANADEMNFSNRENLFRLGLGFRF